MTFLKYNPRLKERARELRKNMTPAEKIFRYKVLKNCWFNILRQKPIDNFIVDFYIPFLKLVIEIDGDSHFDDQSKAYNEERSNILKGLWLTVLRFKNTEIYESIDWVTEVLQRYF